jgi:hypothetical protein
LIQITADLSRVAKQLQRIADILERVFPEPQEEILEPPSDEDLTTYSPYKNLGGESWESYVPRRNY